ncbi:MAG: bifunctional riboflavin kinase/FAD synthetase [Lachnotalea sp.]
MKYIKKIDDIKMHNKTAITLGKFDGVHVGHQKLINNVISKHKEDFISVLFTFDKPVGAFLRDTDTRVLLTKEERYSIFSQYQLDYIIECEFTEEFAHMPAQTFIEEILVGRLQAGYIAVGVDFKFGYKAQGDFKLLQKLATKFGYEVEVVEKVTYKDSEISSTRIRGCIEAGQMEDAANMLGFQYPIIGEVLHGKKLGRTLNIPTTNLIPRKDKLLPPNGVYASRIILDGKVYDGITNIGCKPTVSNELIRGVETYIFDYSGDLYGTLIQVNLFSFERAEQKFKSIEELKEKMDHDIEIVKKYFAKL